MAFFAAAASAVEAAMASARAAAGTLSDDLLVEADKARVSAALSTMGGAASFKIATVAAWAAGTDARAATTVGTAIDGQLGRLRHALQTPAVLLVRAWAVNVLNDPVLLLMVFGLFLPLLCLCAMWRGRPSRARAPTALDHPAAGGAPFPTVGRVTNVGAATGAAAHRRRSPGARRVAPPTCTADDASDGSSVTEDEGYGAAAAAPLAWKLTRDRDFGGYTAAYVRKSRQAAPVEETSRERGRW